MDVQQKLDEIVAAVGSARSMPMSASCVVNRAELLALLEEVRAGAARLPRPGPGAASAAASRWSSRPARRPQRIIESAHAERGSLVSDTEVARRSQDEADRILAEARQEAEEIRAEADDYVDTKLANFEVVLTKTIGSVDRGREKLLGTRPRPRRAGLRGRGRPRAQPRPRRPCAAAPTTTSTPSSAPSRPCSPRPWRPSAAAGRSCTAASPADDLGAHMAAQDAAAQRAAHQRRRLPGRPRGPPRTPRRRSPPQPAPAVPAQQPYGAAGPAAVRVSAAVRRRTATSSRTRAAGPAVRATSSRPTRTPRTPQQGYDPQHVRSRTGYDPQPGPAGLRASSSPAAAGARARRDQPLRHEHDRHRAAAPVRAGRR